MNEQKRIQFMVTVDMEGAIGVTSVPQVVPFTSEWEVRPLVAYARNQ